MRRRDVIRRRIVTLSSRPWALSDVPAAFLDREFVPLGFSEMRYEYAFER